MLIEFCDQSGHILFNQVALKIIYLKATRLLCIYLIWSRKYPNTYFFYENEVVYIHTDVKKIPVKCVFDLAYYNFPHKF